MPTATNRAVPGRTALRRPDVPSAGPARGRRTVRLVGVSLALLVIVAVIVEAVLGVRDGRAHPPPGELVELADGSTLDLDVTTRGSGGPTVVLEAGAGIPSSLWRSTVDAIVETVDGPVTVVAYDRAGSAWSGPASGAPTPELVVADLHEALATKGLPGTHVLVGHSIGGHYVRAFAAAHPAEVAGVVLVDPRREEATVQLPELVDAQARMTRMLRWGVRLRPFGITRLIHQRTDQLPTDLAEQLYALELHRDHLRGSLALGKALDEIDDQIRRQATDLGDIPVRIISAGHVSIVADPVHARELATHIADLLDTHH